MVTSLLKGCLSYPLDHLRLWLEEELPRGSPCPLSSLLSVLTTPSSTPFFPGCLATVLTPSHWPLLSLLSPCLGTPTSCTSSPPPQLGGPFTNLCSLHPRNTCFLLLFFPSLH